jgi:RNA recognition motif-containing protein
MVLPPQQFAEYKLFVGNMPCDVSNEEIASVFGKFGELAEVHIMSGTRSRSGQSSAFVKFMSMDACTAAIAELNMKGRLRPTDTDLLSVKFAKASPSPVRNPASEPSTSLGSLICLDGTSTAASTPFTTPMSSPTTAYRPPTSGTVKVFVGGLPTYVDRDDLIAIFAPFGKVESVHLMNNNKSKSGQACGFVNFHARREAHAAIETLGGKYVLEAEQPAITVRFADSEEGTATKRPRIDELARRLAEQAANEILQA